MPEENNRVVVDQLSDLHFVTEKQGEANLIAERIAPERIKFVGNVMIDTLYDALPRAIPSAETLAGFNAAPAFHAAVAQKGYGFVTLHRPSNVDDPVKLAGAHRGALGGVRAPAAGLRRASAHARQYREGGARRQARLAESGRLRAARLPRLARD